MAKSDRSRSSSSDSNNDKEESIENDIVVTKYQMAAKITKKVLSNLIERCIPGASVYDLCVWSDEQLLEETSKVFSRNKEIKKGIAFPTCISINNCICNFSPLETDKKVELKYLDLIKIDFAVHVDGYISCVAHSFVLGASKDIPVKGKAADAILASHYCAEVCMRLLKPGVSNTTISEHIYKVAKEFNCTPVEGTLMHSLEKGIINGEKSIILNPTPAQRHEHKKADLETFEVYAIDCIISSGTGKGREKEDRSTIYRKTENEYALKLKCSRSFFKEIQKKYEAFPFNIRNDTLGEGKLRIAMKECETHNLLEAYDVLYDHNDEYVAQFKYTVLLMPNGPLKISGLVFDPSIYHSEFSIKNEEIKNLLNKSVSKAKKKKKTAASKSATTLPTPKDEMKKDPCKTESSESKDAPLLIKE